jgi:glycine oxidase
MEQVEKSPTKPSMFTNMKRTADILVIGGGVIGCAIAYYLSKKGVEVTILERDEVGAHASSAAAGIFSLLKPLDPIDAYNRLLLASLALFPSLTTELEAVSGISLEYEQTGTLRTSRHANARQTRRISRWVESCRSMGIQVELLTEEETHRREPLLAPGVCAAVYLSGEGQVKAPNVVAAFAKAAIHYGATIAEHKEVTSIQSHDGRVVSVTTADGDSILCNQLVLAAGAWAEQCGKWLNIALPVIPQRGQILALRQPSPPIRHIIIGHGIYLAPKQDGTVIVGATKEEVGFDTRVTAGGALWLLESAIQLVPALEQCVIERLWAGLRPKTLDTFPILGRATGWENVILAVGHSSFGILLSAITGQTIAELVITGQTPEIICPFSLERFTHGTGALQSSATGQQIDYPDYE